MCVKLELARFICIVMVSPILKSGELLGYVLIDGCDARAIVGRDQEPLAVGIVPIADHPDSTVALILNVILCKQILSAIIPLSSAINIAYLAINSKRAAHP